MTFLLKLMFDGNDNAERLVERYRKNQDFDFGIDREVCEGDHAAL